ncbi:MAG: M3 family oligoendopeptidase [Thermomicrobiales bacterium]
MPTATQPTPDQFADATWDDIAPLFDELANRPLDATTADQWLADWSALEDALSEAIQLASIAYSVDTTDPEKEAANLRFSSEIAPQMDEQRVRLSGRLLDLGSERDDLANVLREFRNQRDLFRPENVAVHQRLEELNSNYNKITGGMTAEWDGEEVPLPRLSPFMQDQDRATRERAFRKMTQPYVDQHDPLAAIFDKQYALRQELAHNAGLANYRDYAFRENNRFDYTPADCEAFHQAIEETVVPALARRHERRREQLGLDTVRPWDLGPDPFGRPALKPFETVDEFTGTAEAIFHKVDPVLGNYFATMRRDGVLDLDSRKGKAPGGYCTSLPYQERPFIFMNAAGTASDVEVLLHEAGHAFHVFESLQLPLSFSRFPGAEMAEVGSMAMELLSAPYIAQDQGGYYSGEETRRARIEHLEGVLGVLPWIATVDAFQHWIYTNDAGGDAGARDAAWVEIFERFNAGVDWSGLEAQRLARWYRQLHIFLYPFYYIEYGIAQLGALQVWRNSLDDQAAAVAAYREALALGNTRPLPELFAAAGAHFSFDKQTVGELVNLVEDLLAQLEN